MLLESSIPETTLDTEHLLIYIERIKASIENDPSLAIGSTKELIEATLKTILNGCSFEFDDKRDDIPKLLKKVQKVLELTPGDVDASKKGADTIRKVLNSLGAVAIGIAELRNLYGSGHGKGQKIQGITSRHAKFVVSSGTALCTFLLETYELRDSLKLEHLKRKFSQHTRTLTFDPPSCVRCIAIHPNNQFLASGDESHKIRIWELSTGRILHEYTRYYYKVKEGDVTDLTFSSDGKFIITTGFVSASRSLQDGAQRKIQVLNWETGEVVDHISNSSQSDSFCAVRLCPNSHIIAFDSASQIELYNIASKQRISTLDSQSSKVKSISFSPNGEILVGGCDDGQIRVWYWKENDASEKLLQVSSSVSDIAFNSDNRLIAIGGEDSKITLFDLIDKKAVLELDNHTSAINSLRFSPDGQILASASKDDTVKLWHVKSGRLLISHRCNSCWTDVPSVSFSSDGLTLAAGLSGGEIKIWH